MISEILASLNILEKLAKFWSWLRGRKPTPVEIAVPPVETVATRLVRLFESHGVHRNQIPRFIGHGLTVKDVQDDSLLLDKLDESLLKDVCERFSVRREWLDGAEPQIHPCHDFYKYPDRFVGLIEKLKASKPEGEIAGVLIAPIEQDWGANALLILQETIGSIGQKPIYRYYLCNNWAFTYWKARAYLTACIAVAWKQNIFIHGIYKQNKEIERLAEGETLLGWQGEGIWKLGHKTWDPEDMALRPEAFLNGIDPGEGNYGIKSGLGLWLDLDQRGLMDAGINGNARQLFEQELAKYSSGSKG